MSRAIYKILQKLKYILSLSAAITKIGVAIFLVTPIIFILF